MVRKARQLARINITSFAIWLFAVPWTAFALFWTAMAAAGSQAFTSGGGWGWASLVFPQFGLTFIVVGFGMLSAPFLPLHFAPRTLFAVTDQRLIKFSLGRTLKAENVPAERLGKISRTERRDGSGSLKIETRIGVDSDGDSTVETFDIGDVENILNREDAIHDMAERARRPAD